VLMSKGKKVREIQVSDFAFPITTLRNIVILLEIFDSLHPLTPTDCEPFSEDFLKILSSGKGSPKDILLCIYAITDTMAYRDCHEKIIREWMTVLQCKADEAELQLKVRKLNDFSTARKMICKSLLIPC